MQGKREQKRECKTGHQGPFPPQQYVQQAPHIRTRVSRNPLAIRYTSLALSPLPGFQDGGFKIDWLGPTLNFWYSCAHPGMINTHTTVSGTSSKHYDNAWYMELNARSTEGAVMQVCDSIFRPCTLHRNVTPRYVYRLACED